MNLFVGTKPFPNRQLGGQLAPRVTDEIAFNTRKGRRLVQNLVKTFWKEWREEFLATLKTQKKWREAKENLRVGDIVLFVDQNAPRGKWHLGRIEKVFPGQDELVHTVQLSARGHKYIRPIRRLHSLNVSGHTENVTEREELTTPEGLFGGERTE